MSHGGGLPGVMLDLKIAGATVIDGTGATGSRTDVGIRDDAIVAVGDLSQARAGRTLNAAGKVLTPGFIDIHSHSDWRLWANRRAESKIRQGVTTEVVGNCGFSPAPASTEHVEELRGFALYLPRGMDFRWRSVGEYLDAFDAEGTAVNVVQLVGHGTLRVAVMGFDRRPPTGRELTQMQRLLAQAVEDGAWGLSTGLIYAPGSYASTEEIVHVARAARGRGIYASHIRGEGETLLDAVAEALRIGREANLPVQVSHLKAAGRPNWGKVAKALALIDAAAEGGLDAKADVYPYTASGTSLRTLLPDWALEGGVEAMLARLDDPEISRRLRREIETPATGQSLLERVGWENIMIAWAPACRDAEGRRVSEIGAARGIEPVDAVVELLRETRGVASMILFQLDERDLQHALAHPRVMIGSDGSALATYGELGEGKPHPRSYGTFPRVLGEYAREQRVLSLPQAVHKMTGLPGQRLGLKDRGVIRAGARADIVIFDAKRVADQATYDTPHRYPLGIEYVIVNGRFVIKDGAHTGSLPGRVLRLP
jgi:N-acyl-D-amino-acid deacylase